MDIRKLIELAETLALPELARAGIALVTDLHAAAAKVPHVLTSGERADFDAIHAEALAANDRLDRELGVAEAAGR